jgi:hypothetical protein
VRASIRSGPFNNLVHRNRNPATIFFDFVTTADRAEGSRAAIEKIAARSLSVRSLQRVVETLVPFVVAVADVAFLRGRVADEHRKRQRKYNRRDAERRAIDKLPHGRLLLRTIENQMAGSGPPRLDSEFDALTKVGEYLERRCGSLREDVDHTAEKTQV